MNHRLIFVVVVHIEGLYPDMLGFPPAVLKTRWCGFWTLGSLIENMAYISLTHCPAPKLNVLSGCLHFCRFFPLTVEWNVFSSCVEEFQKSEWGPDMEMQMAGTLSGDGSIWVKGDSVVRACALQVGGFYTYVCACWSLSLGLLEPKKTFPGWLFCLECPGLPASLTSLALPDFLLSISSFPVFAPDTSFPCVFLFLFLILALSFSVVLPFYWRASFQ